MRKGEVRRQAIVDAARDLFCTKGYLETTVEDIRDHAAHDTEIQSMVL